MKKVTVTALVLVFTVLKSCAQDIDLPPDKLQALLCNKWLVDYALVGGTKIARPPTAANIVYQFNKDKSFITLGATVAQNKKGVWAYDEKKKLIRMVINGKSNMKVISLKEGELVMLADTKDATPDVPMQLKLVFKIQGLNNATGLTKSSAKVFYLNALQKVQTNSMQAAIQDLNKAIALDSNYSDAYLLRGKAKVYLGQNEDACKDAKKAAALGNAEAKTIDEQYCQTLTEEQVLAKIKPLDSLAKIYPSRPEPLYKMSNIYFDAKQYQKSIDYCDKAIAIDSNFAAAYYNKGACLVNMGDKVNGCQLINKSDGMGYDLAIKMKPYCERILTAH